MEQGCPRARMNGALTCEPKVRETKIVCSPESCGQIEKLIGPVVSAYNPIPERLACQSNDPYLLMRQVLRAVSPHKLRLL